MQDVLVFLFKYLKMYPHDWSLESISTQNNHTFNWDGAPRWVLYIVEDCGPACISAQICELLCK